MKRKILVVDDDRVMVETLCDILQLHGWETLRAFDGEAAVALAAEERVDVILMDVMMPRVDGVAALRAIKAHRPGTRVVLMTAYAAQELLAQAERDGVLSILRKPVDLPHLVGLLEDAAAQARSVLVVDDDPDYLGTLCDLLRAKGVAALEARNLTEALEQMARHAPGAVLLDLRLDRANVDPQARFLAIKHLNPAVLLVLYSGHPADLSRTVEDTPPGLVDASFMKPLPIERLLELLHVDARG